MTRPRLSAAQRKMLFYMEISDGTIEPMDGAERRTAAALLKQGWAERCECIVITPKGRAALTRR